jgi:hypothetical protein
MGAREPRRAGRVRSVSGSRKVVLFSPFSPDAGGGGTNLRTLLPRLDNVQVDWLYTAPSEARQPNTVRVAGSLAGGARWHDLSRMVALWSGVPTFTLRAVVEAIMTRGASGYWVVGHNEGIVVARALARRGARVHLTIQDDVPDGVFARSQRYRPLAPFIRPTFESTLRRMASIDVTSDGMQRYYEERLGVRSVVVHPLIEALPAAPSAPAVTDEIRVGHIGSIYALEELRAALRALRSIASERGVRAKMIMIGLAPKYRSVAAEFGDLVALVDDLPETLAVERLFACHFLYAMYPFDARSDVFRRTSLPTKITTYLKCQRPILAHAPVGSTLLDIVTRYGVGHSCTTSTTEAIAAAMRDLLDASVPADAYERARAGVYGVENADRLSGCLAAL